MTSGRAEARIITIPSTKLAWLATITYGPSSSGRVPENETATPVSRARSRPAARVRRQFHSWTGNSDTTGHTTTPTNATSNQT